MTTGAIVMEALLPGNQPILTRIRSGADNMMGLPPEAF